jgi:hypothetical protein
LVVPRALRVELAAAPPAQSWAEDTDAETLCQNSDVAICVPQTSKVQNAGKGWGTSSHEGTIQGVETEKQQLLTAMTAGLMTLRFLLALGLPAFDAEQSDGLHYVLSASSSQSGTLDSSSLTVRIQTRANRKWSFRLTANKLGRERIRHMVMNAYYE